MQVVISDIMDFASLLHVLCLVSCISRSARMLQALLQMMIMRRLGPQRPHLPRSSAVRGRSRRTHLLASLATGLHSLWQQMWGAHHQQS